MTYRVLARKWRPQTFYDLVGQTHVTKALTFALDTNQVHHAYLFTGTRGVGKTSIARVFAKSLNCEKNGVSSKPCGACNSCIEIKKGKFVDLIEVDAASRTGVDETRELIDSVSYLPTKGRYKVYLIDEVHMFSKSSFNALLKTLEEPPEYVKFILATTDPDRLPITVLSRCLQFNLKSLTEGQVLQHLINICESEGIKYEKEALLLLAKSGNGSMRDTLSVTDQAIAYGHGELGVKVVTEILGTINPADIEAILFAIVTNNPNQLDVAIRKLDDYDVDAHNFLVEIMKRLQRMAWAKEGVVGSLSAGLLSTVSDIPKPLLHLWYDIAEKSLVNLTASDDSRLSVEMALLRMLAFIPSDWVVRHRTVLDESLSAPIVEEIENEDSIIEKGKNKLENNNAKSKVDNKNKLSNNNVDLDIETKEKVKSLSNNLSFEENSTHEFASKAVLSPANESNSLEEAERQFGELTSDKSKLSQKIKSKNNLELVDKENKLLSMEDNPDNCSSWFLAEDNSDTAKPTMEEVNSIMQRGCEIGLLNNKTAYSDENDFPPWEDVKIDDSASFSDENDFPPWEDVKIDDSASLVSSEPRGEKYSIDKDESSKKFLRSSDGEEKKQNNNTSVAKKNSVDGFDWLQVVNQLGLSDYVLHFVSLGILKVNQFDGFVDATINLLPANEVMVNKGAMAEFEEALEIYFKQPVKLSVNFCVLDDTTPFEALEKKKKKQHIELLEQFSNDSMVRNIVDNFNGEIIEKTLKPSS